MRRSMLIRYMEDGLYRKLCQKVWVARESGLSWSEIGSRLGKRADSVRECDWVYRKLHGRERGGG